MSKRFFTVLAFLFLLFPIFAFSANIDSTNKYARFLSGDDLINFNPSNGGATVTNSAVTGYVWGSSAGWINLNPTNGGVSNNGSGTLSGYAWGENTGWINFNPTNGGVTIDCNGDFNGYAWSERRGWIVFNCATDSSCSSLSHKVSTTWDGGVCSVSYQCSDGVDNDGDGLTDYPSDSGCSSTTDDNETNGGGGGPGGNPQPQCSDNKDNDLDGLVDRFDNACHTDGDPNNFSSYSPLINDENSRPTVTLVGNTPVIILVGDAFVDPGATAFDIEDGDLTASVVINGSVDVNTVGNYVLLYSVTDSSGSPAIPATRVVNVVSTVPPPPPTNNPPVINLTGGVVTIDEGTNFSEPGFSAFDTEDGDLTSVVLVSAPVNPNVPGSYVVTYEVTDSGGLSTLVTRVVDVVPKNPFRPPPPPCTDCGTGGGGGGGGGGTSTPPLGVPPEEILPSFIQTPLSKALTLAGLALGIFASARVIWAWRIWSWLMAFFGLRKKYKPWGTVYDSQTKQPLDPAYVTLMDLQGKEIATSITDIDGRYGFLVPSGVYTLKAQKTNYTFPSTKLAGKTSDELYTDLYFGGQITLGEEEGVVARNIPMDSLKFDWNEFAKKGHGIMQLYSRFDPVFTRLSDIFFYIGLTISVIAFYLLPEPYNTIVFGLYVILIVLRILGLSPQLSGYVVSRETGRPLSFAIIRVRYPDGGAYGQTEIAKRVCDVYGRYYMLVPTGSYVVTIERKNSDGSYSHVFTSSVIRAKKGIINKKFKV